MILDRFDTRLLILAVSILILSLLDAFFTIYLIDKGATEVNPIMAYFLEMGPAAFVFVKYLLTCLCVVCFLVCHYATVSAFGVRVRILLPATMAVFVMVVLWQMYLQSQYVR